jgi:hypothetical protein
LTVTQGTMPELVDMIGTSVTSAALIVGGIWAYFHFVKRRTYRPRLDVSLTGNWHTVEGSPLLLAHIGATNIGASAVRLRQRGTGLRISALAESRVEAPAPCDWQSLGVFEIFEEHEWIEPGETICDDLLLRLPFAAPMLCRFEVRLVWTWSKRRGNAVDFARRVIPVDTATTRDRQAEAMAMDSEGQLREESASRSEGTESPKPEV